MQYTIKEQTDHHAIAEIWETTKQDGCPDWSVYMKWDGCCELTRFFNGSRDDSERLHICDMKSFSEFVMQVENLRFELVKAAE